MAKFSLSYLKNMLDMRNKLLECAQKDLEHALAELDQCEYILAQAESANRALKHQNDLFKQRYVDAMENVQRYAMENTERNEIINGLLKVIDDLKNQVNWWRQQDSDTAWLCAEGHQPCARRAASDDNTCEHYPEVCYLPTWANVHHEETT